MLKFIVSNFFLLLCRWWRCDVEKRVVSRVFFRRLRFCFALKCHPWMALTKAIMPAFEKFFGAICAFQFVFHTLKNAILPPFARRARETWRAKNEPSFNSHSNTMYEKRKWNVKRQSNNYTTSKGIWHFCVRTNSNERTWKKNEIMYTHSYKPVWHQEIIIIYTRLVCDTTDEKPFRI